SAERDRVPPTSWSILQSRFFRPACGQTGNTKGALMPARSLPPRPNLAQLKLQAKELLREYRDGKFSAAARIEAHHSKHKARLLLADAQLVLAREYGYENWAQVKERIERGRKIAAIKPHPHFDEGLAALRSGDINRLGELLVKHPELIRARTNLNPPYGYF